MLILKTDNGAHPPEAWANATANILFPLVDIAPERLLLARKVQTKIMEVMVGHHGAKQKSEKSNLSAKGDDHLDADNDTVAEATAAYVEILDIVKGTPWEAHFNSDAVRNAAITEIAVHMQTINHIERQWHCHRNKDSAVAQDWLEQHHPAGA